jgi:hypothetical protein
MSTRSRSPRNQEIIESHTPDRSVQALRLVVNNDGIRNKVEDDMRIEIAKLKDDMRIEIAKLKAENAELKDSNIKQNEEILDLIKGNGRIAEVFMELSGSDDEAHRIALFRNWSGTTVKDFFEGSPHPWDV